MLASTPTLLTFGFYILAMLVLGWLGYKATTNFSDYILGGRRLGSVVTALSAGASDMSGWLLMGLPAAVYAAGISGAWIAIGLVCGAYLNWSLVAAALRDSTEKYGNALTLPDYFANRFHDKAMALRLTTALPILIFFTIYCASGMVAGARLFESMFGMPYEIALWIGAFSTITYVFIGGFLAVSWTDTIQATLMIAALIITPIMVIYANGGIEQSISLAKTINPHHLDLIANLSTIKIISLVAWGLGYFGQPHILVRFMAAKSVETIAPARRISMTWMLLCLAGAVAIGFFGVSYFAAHPEQAGAVVANNETVFIELAKLLFNPWISGLLLAAILAAIMSTLSCQLLVCSSALTEDIYKVFLRKNASQAELVWIGRAMVLAVSLIAILLASFPNSEVLTMVSYAWAGFGAAFGPVVLLSLFWKRMSGNGALAGIITGTVTVIVWKQFEWFGLYEMVPGFFLATMAIVLTSILSTQKK